MSLILWSAVRLLWAVLAMVGVYYVLSPVLRVSEASYLVSALIVAPILAYIFAAPWVLIDQWLQQQALSENCAIR